MAYPHVDWPVNVSLSSSLFHAAPFTSNATTGWTSSCSSPDCQPSAVWSTSAPNSKIDFSFWGWDVAFDGQVQGNMSVKFVLDGQDMEFKPSNGELFKIEQLDNLKQHSLSLTVESASAGSALSINQARINASTFSDQALPSVSWDLPSNDGIFQWTGFTQQPSTSGSFSPVTYTSSAAGDKISGTFNGSAVMIYGPCGPTNGLVTFTMDGQDKTTVNTSLPLASSNCLLFQSRGYPSLAMHTLEITNESGNQFDINHFSFFRVLEHSKGTATSTPGAIVGGVIGGIVLIALLIVAYSLRSRKTRQKINRSFTLLCS